jgi:hypothetical protein
MNRGNLVVTTTTTTITWKRRRWTTPISYLGFYRISTTSTAMSRISIFSNTGV